MTATRELVVDSLRYGVGGLGVDSPFSIRGLARSCGGDCDIEISLELGPVPEPARLIFQWPGLYGLGLWRTAGGWLFTSRRDGSYLVGDGGSSIRCFRSAANDDGDQLPGSDRPVPARELTAPAGLQHVLARRVLPRVATLHGRVALHAASVSDGHGAILLLGATHAGKSTLAAALHQRLGWQVLADDISLIGGEHDLTRCFSTGLGTCLRVDALAALQADDAASQPIPHQVGKRFCAPAADAGPGGAASVPLRAIFVLSQADPAASGRVELARISPSHALIAATARLVRFDPTDRRALRGLMNRVARCVETVPAFDISYPRSFGCIPMVTERLRAQLSRAPS